MEQPGSTQCLRAPRAKPGAKTEKLRSSGEKLSPPFPDHANSRAPRDAAYGGTKQLGEGEAQPCRAQSAPLLINLLQSPSPAAQTVQHRAGDTSPPAQPRTDPTSAGRGTQPYTIPHSCPPKSLSPFILDWNGSSLQPVSWGKAELNPPSTASSITECSSGVHQAGSTASGRRVAGCARPGFALSQEMIVIVRGDCYMIINNNTTRKNRRQSAEPGWEGKREACSGSAGFCSRPSRLRVPGSAC